MDEANMDKKNSVAAQQQQSGIHGAEVGTETGLVGDAADAGIGSGTTTSGLPATTNRSGLAAKILAGLAIAVAVVLGLVLQTAFLYILLVLIPVLAVILIVYLALEKKRNLSRNDEPQISTVMRKTP